MKGWMAGQKSSVSTDLLVYGSAAQAGILKQKNTAFRSVAAHRIQSTGANVCFITEEFVLCFIMNEGRF